MQGWQRRYANRKEEAFQRIKKRLDSVECPQHIRKEVWHDVVYETAKKLSTKYMTSIRQGEGNE